MELKNIRRKLYKPAGVELFPDEDDMLLHQGEVLIMELEKIFCAWRK